MNESDRVAIASYRLAISNYRLTFIAFVVAASGITAKSFWDDYKKNEAKESVVRVSSNTEPKVVRKNPHAKLEDKKSIADRKVPVSNKIVRRTETRLIVPEVPTISVVPRREIEDLRSKEIFSINALYERKQEDIIDAFEQEYRKIDAEYAALLEKVEDQYRLRVDNIEKTYSLALEAARVRQSKDDGEIFNFIGSTLGFSKDQIDKARSNVDQDERDKIKADYDEGIKSARSLRASGIQLEYSVRDKSRKDCRDRRDKALQAIAGEMNAKLSSIHEEYDQKLKANGY